jgi:hypothetical protein
MVLPLLSLPKDTIFPATWAPTSTTSSGSTVPVAPMVAMRPPRFTVTVRKGSSIRSPRPQYQVAEKPIDPRRSTAMSFLLKGLMAYPSFLGKRVSLSVIRTVL